VHGVGDIHVQKHDVRKLVGQWDHAVYQAVKAGRTETLSWEGQLLAKAIQDHLHLPHVHTALEFADVREGVPYLVGGQSPLAHLAIHAAVEAQIAESADVKAAFDVLLASGTDRHHAVHLLGMLFSEYYAAVVKASNRGEEPSDKFEKAYNRKLRKICTDSMFRKKWIRKSSGGHPWAEKA
jgi:hypothetical protein